MTYDSTQDTIDHIKCVRLHLLALSREMGVRGELHDQSKLAPPEKEIFDAVTARLKTLEYGSPEYFESLKEMKPALDHHYSVNPHHPEYHKEGVDGMDLVDLVEMFCDWAAACQRHPDGDLRKSIEFNRTRFGLSDQLTKILLNTVKYTEDC